MDFIQGLIALLAFISTNLLLVLVWIAKKAITKLEDIEKIQGNILVNIGVLMNNDIRQTDDIQALQTEVYRRRR